MKLILLILFAFPVVALSQAPPQVIAQANSVYTNKTSDTLAAIGCDPNCGGITSWHWSQIFGPITSSLIMPQAATGNTTVLVVNNLRPGSYIYRADATTLSGKTAGDTVGFTVVPPPIIIHDTIPRVCPVCPVCPPPPPPRKATNVCWDKINKVLVISYDSGPDSNLQ